MQQRLQGMLLPLSFKLCKKKVQCDRENTKLKVESKSCCNNCINYCKLHEDSFKVIHKLIQLLI